MSIKQQASKSVFWSAVERLSTQGVQFLLSLIIARILLPSDYGLIAMLAIFLAIAQTFIDSGFAFALIQRKNRTEADYSTAFYFNVGIAVIIYFLLYLSAPAIASFYEESQLIPITRVVGIILIINAFGIVQQAKLTIELNFKKQAVASLISVVIGGILGVIMAYKGYAAWALVCQTLCSGFLRVALLNIYSKWLPRERFSVDSFKVLFSFGSKLLGAALINTLYTNLYAVIIGKKFSSDNLGFFNRASTLAQFPSLNFSNIIVRAIYPIQTRLQDDDEQLLPLFINYLRMSCFVIFPIMIAFAVVAEPLIRLLLTDKWLPTVPLLQILCMAYMWDPVMKINSTMLSTKGRTDYSLYAEIWKKSIGFIILFATMPFGIEAMCWGLVLYAFVDMTVVSIYVYRLTKITLFTQFKALMPVILLSFSMGLVMYMSLMLFTNIWLQLLIPCLIGVVFYICIAFVTKMSEMKVLLSLLHKM